MQIAIKNATEFHSLLTTLVGELTQAGDHFRLVRDLDAARGEFAQAFNQSQTFWYLTRRAHLDATLQRLCKAYDQHKTSLNLRNLLDTIEANLPVFDEAEFRERLKDNPFVDALAQDVRRPDAAQLRADKQLVSQDTDARVKNLMMWRHLFVAHRDPGKVLKGVVLAEQYPLSFTAIQSLLDDGRTIVNRYSSLFIATTHAGSIVGHDDYLTILKAVQTDLEQQEARLQEQLAQLAGE
jgi:HEPN superfamily AbiU2-like protein